MLCEKCGKNNEVNSATCSHCGSEMPSRDVCGGFGDILNYESQTPERVQSISDGTKEGSFEDIKKLSKQISSLRKANNRILSISLVSFVVGVMAMAIALVAVFYTPDVVETEKPAVSSAERKEEVEASVDNVNEINDDVEPPANTADGMNDEQADNGAIQNETVFEMINGEEMFFSQL